LSESWAPVVVGDPTTSFEPRPAAAEPYRPDTVADGWSTDQFTVRAASVRGYAHRYQGVPREDDFAVAVRDTGALVVAVADGVSGAEQSHVGATLVCRTAVDFLLRNETDWSELARCASWALVEYASRRLPEPDPVAAERLLATTLVVALVQPDGRATVVQLGDSGAWLLQDRRYENLVRGKHGDVIPNDVSALPRVPAKVVEHTTTIPENGVLLVGTDGFGDPLGDGTGKVGALFAEHLTTPPAPLGLAHLLDFSRETYDDDRTLVAVWRRP
jgi:serine/threonine protein phosphatase PrpC